MEVHHHPHVEKKNFKEYFLEFLMIFLAVTLGFIAENIRENISDNKRLNEYIWSMISDLKNDVSMYHTNDSLNLNYCNMVDTIFTLVNSNTNTGKLYYLARKMTIMGSTGPSVNAKTYLQMMSTGSFRLIKHQRVADSIALYYQLIKSFDDWSELQRTRVNSLISQNDKLFNARVFFSIKQAIESNSDSLQKAPGNNPALMSKDTRDINNVLMQYQYYYGFLKLMNKRSSAASEKAKQLIKLLEKEYNVKE